MYDCHLNLVDSHFKEFYRLLPPDPTMIDWIQSPQYAMLALVSALEVFLV